MSTAHPSPPQRTGSASGRQPPTTAALWWVADVGGAVLFALCLALYLGEEGEGAAPWLLIGIALSGLLRALAQGRAMIAGQRSAARHKHSLRGHLLAALLPTGLIRGRLAGEDLRVAIDDVEASEGLIARFAPLRLASVLSPLLIAAAVACASWVAALIMLATLIPFGIGMALVGLTGKSEADRQFQALSRLSGLFVDRAAALPVILSFAAEDRVTRQIGSAAREVAERTLNVLLIAFVSSAVLEFFAALSVALVAVYCGFSLLGLLPFPAPETLNLTRAFFALAMAPEFYLGMRRLAAAYHDKQQGEAAMGSIDAALAEAREEAPSTPRALGPAPEISLEALEIAYLDGSRIGPVTACWRGSGLHVVSGATGAGKSSVLHALMGMVPVASGVIRLKDEAIAPASLNPLTGWAGQRPLLLPGTLADNLCVTADAMDDDAVAALIAACGLGPLIAQRGMTLPLDSRGSGLSGGERRRIGLVRAVASNRPLLLLDEPTADLDPETAAQIIAVLRHVARDRLIIAATHDTALIARADSVVSLP